jgi:hypothetical protein
MILLDRRLKNTLPRNCGVVDLTPCSKCSEYMVKGVIVVSIKNDTTEESMKGPIPNPYRTGGWAVVTDDFVKRAFTGVPLEAALKNRFMFVTDEAWIRLGLPELPEES